ncbi:radical SAM family heme chaperone HemW [Saccharicrinis aurantiacus]|uniref:radical SAM family heme chaperone HemW n=1 Tax=Saccharicrinis aurantiacus TaxID=1849719 RepID=UPI00094FFB01|nr:radical SAM family heme chaperone HemW [Saccharicrinis aurantiacus]
MIGIYIHVPFCSKKCGYCDFYSIIRLTNKSDYLNALIKEIELRADEFNTRKVATIYFGGGTPSLLSLSDFKSIFDVINKTFDISLTKEITVEVNPDDVTVDYIKGLKAFGVNRISMGVQSFNNRILKFMNRRHNKSQAVEAVNNIREAGINNLSIDLIYGIPGMTSEEWNSSINEALSLGVQHISAYHLTFEPDTPFYKRLQKKEILEINDSESVKQYDALVEGLAKGGFNDYEISNFSLPDYESNHNSNYWNGNKYFGFGPSAHSFDGTIRRWNYSNLDKYVDGISTNQAYFDSESLSLIDSYNETIMLSLRTKKGLSLDVLKSKFESTFLSHFNTVLQDYLDNSKLIIDNGFVSVKRDSKFLTDKIISDFFMV